MFDDQLIKEIKKHRCIYDRRVCVFRSRAARRNAWHEIAQALNATEENCQGRWKTLRDRYVKEINKQLRDPNEAPTRWAFFHKLAFLKDAISISSSRNSAVKDESNDYKDESNDYKDDTNDYRNDSNESFADSVSPSEAFINAEDTQFENPLEISPSPSRKRKAVDDEYDDFERVVGRVTRIVEKKLDVRKVEEDPYLPVIGRLMKKVDDDQRDDLYMEIINFVHEKVKELMEDQ